MNQRVAKVESLIQAVVAPVLLELLERDGAALTVTRIDAAPDLRNATVWVGVLGNTVEQERLWSRVMGVRHIVQDRLSAVMKTRYAPMLHFKRDTGGAYAEQIDRLLKGLS